MKKRIKKISFYKTIRLWGIVFLAALATAITSIDFATTHHDFNIRMASMRTNHFEQQKQSTKREVDRIVDIINHERMQSEKQTKDEIKSRVYEAHAIAQNIYQQNKNSKSNADIQQMIIDVLRPIRFAGGNGYYFIARLNGIVLLSVDQPETEGLNLLDMQDSPVREIMKDAIKIAMQSGEDFYEYLWTKPQSTGNNFKKISFIKKFEPCDLFIGTGLYVEDIEEEIKADWMERINNIRFGKNQVGYLFVDDWNGKALAHGAQPDLIGTDMWETEDSRGNKTTQLLIAASKNQDGGYTSFWWRKPDTNEERPKIAYAKGIPEWELLIASGVYTDDIEQNINILREELNAHTKTKILILSIITAIAFILFFLFFNLLSNRLKRDLNMFVSFFEQAAFSDKKIDRETIQFSEFDQMAKSANKMLVNRKKAEEEINSSKLFIESVVEMSPYAMWISDKEGTIIRTNQSLRKALNTTDDMIIGKYNMLKDKNNEDQGVMPMIKAVFEKHESANFSIPWAPSKTSPTNFKQTPKLYIEASIFPILNAEGELTNTVCQWIDITERMHLQAQLIQAHKMESVGRLAGGVAHDYNNISSIILGYSELALDKIEKGTPLHDYLTEILNSAKRSADITQQLLTFARKQTIAPKIIDLNKAIESLLKMLQRLIGEDINLIWIPGEKLQAIKIDPSQINQIMANLCVNARDAIANVGEIIVKTENIIIDENYRIDNLEIIPGSYILLSVEDNGCGMTPETINNIFEPFFTTKDIGKGTGLGLSTIYGIVKQNNGFIQTDSKIEKGTTFNIYLPAHIGQIDKPDSPKTANIPSSNGETILLVDDDKSILKIVRMVLERLGYTVLVSLSPAKAIKQAKEHEKEISLLITDVIMPEMNGHELSESLHKLYPNIKTLFMSGYTADIIANRGVLESGINFISKPFSNKDIAIRVREVLNETTI